MANRSQAELEIQPARLSGFAPAIARLQALGVPAQRIGELFGADTGYIHVLSHRARKQRSKKQSSDGTLQISAVSDLSDDYVIAAKEELGLRSESEDRIELTPKRLRNLEWLESRMVEIADRGRSSYQYLPAIKALRELKPQIGFPSDVGRIRIAAKLHQHLAWFYTHSGLANSSVAEANRSIRLYEILYHETRDKDALRELGGSCLIRSNSRLSDGSGEVALGSLKLSEQVTLAADIALNSEYFQQRGVALFQTRQDDAAKKMFERARATTPDTDVKHASMTLKMSSDRFLNLIASPFPKLESELSLLADATAFYGPDSLEAVMCAHWAAACALCTDSKSAHLTALDLIEQNQSKILRFAHQATIAKLLPLALELPSSKRLMWVRFSLYQNAFRSK